MSIMTVEMRGLRGFGDVRQNILNSAAINRARTDLAVRMPQVFGADSATVVAEGDFVSTYGVPIGAGVAAFAVGLVIAKLARRRK